MIALLSFVLAIFVALFKSKSRLEAENAVLRHQLIVLRCKVRGRVRLTNNDRCFLIQLYRWFPSILKVLTIIRPETLVRWHRAGFRGYWRWKSRQGGGRPQIDTDLRALIRRMSIENPLWGAPRIHGELLKLGFEVAQSSVAKYMVKRPGPPSQGWRTFLRNHAPDIAAMDLFVVPTIGFDLLYAFIALIAGLPVAVWLDLRNLTETALLRQARDLNSVVSSVRAYYATNVVGRVLAANGLTQVAHNYASIDGAIPIPATLSLELGRVISEQQHNIAYRFVSDYPFENRSRMCSMNSRKARSHNYASIRTGN